MQPVASRRVVSTSRVNNIVFFIFILSDGGLGPFKNVKLRSRRSTLSILNSSVQSDHHTAQPVHPSRSERHASAVPLSLEPDS